MKPARNMAKRLLAVGTLILVLSGCGEVALHHDLSESDADKILVLLDKNGIGATKEKEIDGQNVSWTVKVPQGDVAAARRLLVENNLPHRRELGLSGVYQEKGLIPTPDEQKARFLLAMKGEIINALRAIPGVYDVGVVLNVPDDNELKLGEPSEARPSASVVLRIGQKELDQIQLNEEKVRRFVANAVPEMSPSDVIVIISSDARPAGDDLRPTLVTPPAVSRNGTAVQEHPVSPPPVEKAPRIEGENLEEVAGIKVDSASMTRFRVYLVIILCVLILLSVALLFTLYRFGRVRRHSGAKRLRAVSGREGGHELLGPGAGGGPGETGTGT